ncbi:MAG: hypothetical protein JW384_01877 [Nitrosomonadaceae bacterium]|nr:hypothetical protein [Nitrosomonadaceae bacterium]
MPDGFRVTEAISGRESGLVNLGAPNRRGGLFGIANCDSPIGGLIIVIGLSQLNSHRWIIGFGGLVTLALSQGRTAIFATVAGLLVVLIWSPLI